MPDRARKGTIGVVASNSFAFGGNNASLLFSPPDSDDSRPEYLNFTLEMTGVGAIAGHAVDTLQVADKLFDGTRLYDEVATVREGALFIAYLLSKALYFKASANRSGCHGGCDQSWPYWL